MQFYVPPPPPLWVAQWLKNPPARQETWVRSLGQEDTLEKEMATHSSILAWEIPRTVGAWWVNSPQGCKESDTTEGLNTTKMTNAVQTCVVLIISVNRTLASVLSTTCVVQGSTVI